MKSILAFLVVLCSFAHGQEEPLRLKFGVYPSDRATVMYRKFSPVLDAIRVPLENQLERQVDIHMTIFEDYSSGIEALANGEVDFVRFGPSSYILAEEMNPNVQLLAMELRKGLKQFNGFIITKSDSGIQTLQDLKGRSFAFGDENSTTGTFLSQSLLVKNGIHTNSLSEHDFLGRHDLVAKAVITGTHDAGALKDSTYKKLCNSDDIIVIKAFPNVTKPWIASSTLQKPICDAITNALLHLEDETVLSELGCSGFSETSPGEYTLVREGMTNSKLFQRYTNEQIDTLTEQEVRAELALVSTYLNEATSESNKNFYKKQTRLLLERLKKLSSE